MFLSSNYINIIYFEYAPYIVLLFNPVVQCYIWASKLHAASIAHVASICTLLRKQQI